MKKQSNFSRAVDELIKGQIKSTEDDTATDNNDDYFQKSEPAAQRESFVSTPSSVQSQPVVNPIPKPSYDSVNQHAKEDAFIPKDMIIKGTVTAISNMRIAGNITGDVIAEGNITLNSCTIEGNISGHSVIISGSTITGDINAKSQLSIDKDSKIAGTVKGEIVDVDGSLKDGDVIAYKRAVLRPNAILHGNISSAALAIDEGAEIKGNIEVLRTSYAQEQRDSAPSMQTPTQE